MKDFDLLCREFEKMDPLSYDLFLTQKATEIIPVLSETAENGIAGTAIFFTFILGAISADGKISKEEYELILPTLKKFFGNSVDYSMVKEFFKDFKKEGSELKNVVDQMVDILGLFSDELKQDVIIVCMLICAVDGKINSKEKKWIMQLIK